MQLFFFALFLLICIFLDTYNFLRKFVHVDLFRRTIPLIQDNCNSMIYINQNYHVACTDCLHTFAGIKIKICIQCDAKCDIVSTLLSHWCFKINKFRTVKIVYAIYSIRIDDKLHAREICTRAIVTSTSKIDETKYNRCFHCVRNCSLSFEHHRTRYRFFDAS